MDFGDVRLVLEALQAERCLAWVGGGWGVDALVGRTTRAHRDLDLVIDASEQDAVIGVLEGLGFSVETDWRPVRVELWRPPDLFVDLHPVVFDLAGHGRQQDLDGGFFDYPPRCFTSAVLEGYHLTCLSVDQQVRFHAGYELQDRDRHDLDLLRELSGDGR